MDFEELLNDKNIKSKARTEILGKWILKDPKKLKNLIGFAGTLQKDPHKAICIEAIEFATRVKPAIATKDCLEFVTKTLAEKAPRVKMESARVIANIVSLFPKNLEESIINLLDNSEHEGTVVRWSAATALREIIKMETPLNKKLIPAVEVILKREEQNSIRKIYVEALEGISN